MSEPAFMGILRAQVDKPDESFGATVVSPPGSYGVFRALGIRPELLSENMNRERIYRITPKQARKALKRWESVIAAHDFPLNPEEER